MRKKVDRELEKALHSVLQRISYQHYFNWLLRGLAAGILISACFLLLSRFWPWAEVKTFCLLGAAIVLLLALMIAFFKRPDIWEAACRADACGLKERVSTACELSGLESDIARRQREDALQNLNAINAKDKFPFFVPLRERRALGGAVLLLLLLVYLPNPMQAQVEKQQEIIKEIACQEKKIEEVKKELQEKEEKFSLEERAELIDVLEDLQKDLQEADKLEEALKSLSGAETEMQEKQASGDSGEDIQELLAEMKENESSRELAEKMAAGDIEGSQKELDKLLDKEGEMPGEGNEAEESEEEMLEKALAQIPDAKLAAALRNEANAAQNGEGGDGTPQSNLNNALGRMCSQAACSTDASQAQAALQNARQGLLAAGNSNSSGQLASSGGATGDPGTGGDGAQSGEGAGGSGSASGSTNSNGTGAGSGQGQGSGPGAGMGSSAGNESQTGQSSSSFPSGANNSPVMSMGEYEKIFDPERIGRAGDASYVKGEAGEGPQQTFDTADPAVVNEALRPYQEVVGHYSQVARESLDRSPIPAGMADVVRDYFTSLE